MGIKSTDKKWPPNRIRVMREYIGMEPEELAELYGSDKETIRRYEISDRDISHEKMIELATALSKNKLGIMVEPYELIISTEEVIDKKAPLLTRHFDLINGYLLLDEEDRAAIDRQLQGFLALKNAKQADKLKQLKKTERSQESA